jgi:CheY-like chemotaxis protein
MTATIAGPDVELYPGSGTAAVVGDDDAVTQLLEEVLSRHQYQVVRHHSPDELLGDLREEPDIAAPLAAPAPSPEARTEGPAPSAAREDGPSLYIFNFAFSGWERGSRKLSRVWWAALEEVSTRAPMTAIVVVFSSGDAHGLIRRALQAGADEILRADDAEIEELVWTRVQSALAKARCTPRKRSTVLRVSFAPSPAGERRSADGGTAIPPVSGVLESWDAPASEDEVRAAQERVRAALGSLPTAEERRGPYADLLGVSVPALRAESGRLDARKISDHLGISLASLARIASISRQALTETPDSVRAQHALDPLARTLHVLGTLLPPEHVRAWLNAPHARLGGETPIHAILQGRAEQVARMVEMARDGGVD